MTALRRRMIEELRLRNYSPHTITVYIRGVAQFAQHFRLPPEGLGAEHIRQYQLLLVQQKKVSGALFKQTVGALRFFYHPIRHRDWMIKHIPDPRHEDKLPVVLSPAAVAAGFEATHNLKQRTLLMTIDAGGLRVSEVSANCQQSNKAKHDFRSVAAALCFQQVSDDKQKYPEP